MEDDHSEPQPDPVLTPEAVNLKTRHVLARNNGQEVFKKLQELGERQEQYRARWLWELVQNGRDAHLDRPLHVEVTLTEAELTFRHDGRPFAEDEVYSLILHGSTKSDDSESALGKYGTGFLATHLLSPTVLVSGTLSETQRATAGFSFVLDRSGSSGTEVQTGMERTIDAFVRSVNSGEVQPTGWTEYLYPLTPERSLELANALSAQLPAIPYAIVFDSRIGDIEVSAPSGTKRFASVDRTSIDGHLQVVSVAATEEGALDRTVHFLLQENADEAVAVPVAADGTSWRLSGLGNTPRLFKHLPLLGTAEIGLPIVFHSSEFRPREERDGPYLTRGGSDSEINKDVLVRCAALFVHLAQACADATCADLHHLLHVHQPSAGRTPWLEDVDWFADFQRQLVTSLSTVPLVLNSDGVLLPTEDATIPVEEGLLPPEAMVRLATPIFGAALPAPQVAMELSRCVESWKLLFGDDEHPLLERCLLNFARLAQQIGSYKTLAGLAGAMDGSKAEAVAWLDGLLGSLPDTARAAHSDGLLPNQLGEFTAHALLARDEGVGEELKDLLELMGEQLRASLLHPDIGSARSAVARVETEEQVVPRMKDALKRRAESALPLADPKLRQASLLAFGWFAERGRWTDLGDAIPVFALDRDEQETLTATTRADHRLIVPRFLWPDAARPYWSIFPASSVLVDDYAPLLSSETWDRVAQEGLVTKELVWSESMSLEGKELDRWLVRPLHDEEQHVAVAGEGSIIDVGKLAFVDHFYESLRHSPLRTVAFLRFIFEYVAEAETLWAAVQTVGCECGRKHELVPCDWLAWLREKAWVPRGKSSEQVSTESLAGIAERSPELVALMMREEAQPLLELLGINILEQTLLAHEESERSAWRRRLAEIAKAGELSEVDVILERLEERRQVRTRWASNQALGRRVEELVRSILNERDDVRVEPHFKGYDLEAYFNRLLDADEDVGRIELGLMKIEIKSTRSDAVSMSTVQAKEASEDSHAYWLAVIELDPSLDVEAITSNHVGERISLVPDVGEILARPEIEIERAISAAEEWGVELQRVEQIRYLIPRAIWASRGVDLETFVSLAAARLGVEAGP